MFNTDQVKSFFRSVVIAAGAFFVGKGWLSNEMVVEIAGGASAFIAAAWGLYFHSGSKKQDLVEVVAGVASEEKDEIVTAQAYKAVA